MPDVLGNKNAGMSFHAGAIHLAKKKWTQAINRLIIKDLLQSVKALIGVTGPINTGGHSIRMKKKVNIFFHRLIN
jgi:hypothetical protein